MKLPRRLAQIKQTAADIFAGAWPLWACLGVCLSGCSPLLGPATFPARIDTTQPGSLAGPFDGRVVDAESGKPIAGASVYASWGFSRFGQPSGAYELLKETDSDGRYLIPRLPELPPFPNAITRFTLIVYQRGYVAYRSDTRFEDGSTRHDFAQHASLARLDRFGPKHSHARHVVFIGGGAVLRRELEAERVQASLELAEGAKSKEVVSGTGLLDATPLLSPAELKAVTGFEGEFQVARLGDLARATDYDSVHFRAVNLPETFDAALRVWKLAGADLDARFDETAKTVPDAREVAGLGDRAVHGRAGRILAVVVEDRARGAVVELTCGEDQCKSIDVAVAIMKRILPRAERLKRTEDAR